MGLEGIAPIDSSPLMLRELPEPLPGTPRKLPGSDTFLRVLARSAPLLRALARPCALCRGPFRVTACHIIT